MSTFTAEDYRYPIAELKLGKPESEEWKLFSSTDEIKVYAFLDQETGYFQWKVCNYYNRYLNSVYKPLTRKFIQS